MPQDQYNVLIAEDDQNLGHLLVDYLEAENYKVTLCKNGLEALRAFESNSFHICLLDIMMPKMDGFELTKTIREKNTQIPILFITAKSLKEDRLKGYSLGADDYVTKPFDEEELLCKIHAIIRRSVNTYTNEKAEIIPLGKYSFDFNNQALLLSGKTKRITEKESEILKFLSNRRNQIVKREELLKSVWGGNDYFAGRSLDVFITKIRKYLSEDADLNIENVFGVGFILNDLSKK